MSPIATLTDFKYEVAFSFLTRDEHLAHQLSDSVADLLKTFIYTEQQKVIIGKDGMETYRKVFIEEARIVVILYREEWGQSGMTRVEHDAIHDRAYEQGQGFIVLINLDKGSPVWMSRSHIRLDFDRQGVVGAKAVIETRVDEYGGTVREETLMDVVERNKRAEGRRAHLSSYYTSPTGQKEAHEEVLTLMRSALAAKDGIMNTGHGFTFNSRESMPRMVMLSCEGSSLRFLWKHGEYSKAMSGSILELKIADTSIYDGGPTPSGRTHQIAQYAYVLNAADTKGWQPFTNHNEFYTSERLVEHGMKLLVERVELNRQARDKRIG